MRYRIIILVLLFYFLILLQNSFFAHFSMWGIAPNFVLILACLVSFFFSQKNMKAEGKYAAIFLMVIAGFLLDVFSDSFLGISIAALLAIYFFIRKSVDLLRDVSKEFQIVYFLPIFIVSFLIYNLILDATLYFFGLRDFSLFANINLLLTNIIYNSLGAVLGFYIFALAQNGIKKI